MFTFWNQVIRIPPKVAKLQNESESYWSNLGTSVAATINFFSYDKKLIAAATVKTPYFNNGASKVIFLQRTNMLEIFNSRDELGKAAKIRQKETTAYAKIVHVGNFTMSCACK